MSATMQDVARLAGVSVKTVSNVLNEYPYVREDTRLRVMAAVAELGYSMNFSARNLRRGSTGMIALILPELSLSYFAELADQVIAEAEGIGYTVLIELTGGEREKELEVLSSPRRRMTDGAIFSPLALDPSDVPALDVAFPLVLLGERVEQAPVDHVTMSNVAAAQAATQFLIDRGCRRIALLGHHAWETMSSAVLRTRGYLAAHAQAGLPVDERLLATADPWHRAQGVAAMAAMLDAGLEPDGVFGMNDALALGAMFELQRRGIAVPDDVQIMGFDDVEDARYAQPGLTTVNPGRRDIARLAVERLHRRIAGEPATQAQLFQTGFEIVERGSTRH